MGTPFFPVRPWATGAAASSIGFAATPSASYSSPSSSTSLKPTIMRNQHFVLSQLRQTCTCSPSAVQRGCRMEERRERRAHHQQQHRWCAGRNSYGCFGRKSLKLNSQAKTLSVLGGAEGSALGAVVSRREAGCLPFKTKAQLYSQVAGGPSADLNAGQSEPRVRRDEKDAPLLPDERRCWQPSAPRHPACQSAFVKTTAADLDFVKSSSSCFRRAKRSIPGGASRLGRFGRKGRRGYGQ